MTRARLRAALCAQVVMVVALLAQAAPAWGVTCTTDAECTAVASGSKCLTAIGQCDLPNINFNVVVGAGTLVIDAPGTYATAVVGGVTVGTGGTNPPFPTDPLVAKGFRWTGGTVNAAGTAGATNVTTINASWLTIRGGAQTGGTCQTGGSCWDSNQCKTYGGYGICCNARKSDGTYSSSANLCQTSGLARADGSLAGTADCNYCLPDWESKTSGTLEASDGACVPLNPGTTNVAGTSTAICRAAFNDTAADTGKSCDQPESCPVPKNVAGTAVVYGRDAYNDGPTRNWNNATELACPADLFVAANQVNSGGSIAAGACRGSKGACDKADYCNGTQYTCTADVKFGPQGTANALVCRGSVGDCDQADYCDGTANVCGADLKYGAQGSANAKLCRASRCGTATSCCDKDDWCDNSSNSCAEKRYGQAGQPAKVCRAAASTCDVAESCAGTVDSCPTNAFASNTVTCADGNTCNGTEKCDGAGNCSPAPAFLAESTCCNGGGTQAPAGCTSTQKGLCRGGECQPYHSLAACDPSQRESMGCFAERYSHANGQAMMTSFRLAGGGNDRSKALVIATGINLPAYNNGVSCDALVEDGCAELETGDCGNACACLRYNYRPLSTDPALCWANQFYEDRKELVDRFRHEGFDVAIIIYHDDGLNLVLNGELTLRAIQYAAGITCSSTWQSCSPRSRSVAAVGYSMGGVLTRYALNMAEALGVDHGADVFVSLDAPQRGANVNPWLLAYLDKQGGLPYSFKQLLSSHPTNYRGIGPEGKVIAATKDCHCTCCCGNGSWYECAGTSAPLCEDGEDWLTTSSAEFDTFQTSLQGFQTSSGVGWPGQTFNLGVALGATATRPPSANGLLFSLDVSNACNQNYGAKAEDYEPGSTLPKSLLDAFFNNNNGQTTLREFLDGGFISWLSTADDIVTIIAAPTPWGVVVFLIKEALKSLIIVSQYRFNLQYPQPTFIPTWSALGTFPSLLTGAGAYTPFDRVIIPQWHLEHSMNLREDQLQSARIIEFLHAHIGRWRAGAAALRQEKQGSSPLLGGSFSIGGKDTSMTKIPQGSPTCGQAGGTICENGGGECHGAGPRTTDCQHCCGGTLLPSCGAAGGTRCEDYPPDPPVTLRASYDCAYCW